MSHNTINQAILSNQGNMTSFRYGNCNIRFRTPSILKKYTEIKEWDNGYLVEGMNNSSLYFIQNLLNLFRSQPCRATLHYSLPLHSAHYLSIIIFLNVSKLSLDSQIHQ